MGLALFREVVVTTMFLSIIIHSALERNAATLRKVLAPFSFSHVTDSCSLFITFPIFPSFFLSFFLVFITFITIIYLTIILRGRAGYRMIDNLISSKPE